MKITFKKTLIIMVWILIIAFLVRLGLVRTDVVSIMNLIEGNPLETGFLFLVLSVIRVFLFIPSIIFIVLGGMCFGPVYGFILSLISIALSETIVYFMGRNLIGNNFYSFLEKKHQNILELTKNYGYEFLAFGIICPIAPSDFVCFTASALNFQYRYYLLTVVTANIPMMLLYSFLGKSIWESTSSSILLTFVIVIIFIYTTFSWQKMKKGKLISST